MAKINSLDICNRQPDVICVSILTRTLNCLYLPHYKQISCVQKCLTKLECFVGKNHPTSDTMNSYRFTTLTYPNVPILVSFAELREAATERSLQV